MEAKWIWENPHWPEYTFEVSRLVARLGAARRAQGRLEMVVRLLDPALAREALAEAMKVEGLSTSAIEGEVLNPESIAASVARQLDLPRDPAVPLDPEAEGLVAVLHDAVQSFRGPLTLARLCGWQGGLFPGGWSDLHRVAAGRLRPGEVVVASGPVGRQTIHFEAVPRMRLEPEMDAFIAWFNGSQGSLDGLIRAGLAHLWLVTLHPFEDGNGRIARALTDMALAQDGGRPDGLIRMSARILAVRKEYYAALQEAQQPRHGLDATAWLGWFLTQLEAACAGSEQVIQKTLAKARFWSARRDLQLNERQRKVLNRLLDAGPGGFEGGLSARRYGSITHSSKPTATRDLKDLLDTGCLVSRGLGGRSTSFELPWEELLG